MKKILKTFKILSFIIIPPLIVFIYFFGWGWLVPYELQPSYWQFRNMCKLNELPNNEEKYNKILSYFDTDLESLDWEELNGKVDTMSEQQYFYSPNKIEYKFFIGKIKNSRYSMTASFYSNEKILRKDNITLAIILGRWHTKRFYPDGNEGSGFYWSEGRLGCSDISEYNMNPKEANNAK